METMEKEQEPSQLKPILPNPGSLAFASVEIEGNMWKRWLTQASGFCTAHSLKVLKAIARSLSFSNNTFRQFVNYLHQQLSFKLWQYNAKMIPFRLSPDVRDVIYNVLSLYYTYILNV